MNANFCFWTISSHLFKATHHFNYLITEWPLIVVLLFGWLEALRRKRVAQLLVIAWSSFSQTSFSSSNLLGFFYLSSSFSLCFGFLMFKVASLFLLISLNSEYGMLFKWAFIKSSFFYACQNIWKISLSLQLFLSQNQRMFLQFNGKIFHNCNGFSGLVSLFIIKMLQSIKFFFNVF